MQPDRALAERMAIEMRNGLLLGVEPGIVATKHETVECSNERGPWICRARVEVCRPSSPPSEQATVPAPTAPPAPKAAAK